MSTTGWIGVDLDGTLAVYDGWRGIDHIGAPIAPMVERVRGFLAEGREVRIFTARVWENKTRARKQEAAKARKAIEAWCLIVFGRKLPVTNIKDFLMVELYDDRAIRVLPNTGIICCEERKQLCL